MDYFDSLRKRVPSQAFVEDAYTVGVLRHLESLKKKRKESFKKGKSRGVEAHKDGALGEACFCEVMGLVWPRSIGTFALADVGDYEVKTTSYREGRLFIGVDDPLERRFVLVILDLPYYSVVGWVPGDRVKRYPITDEGDRGAPAYTIPQGAMLSPWLLLWELEDRKRREEDAKRQGQLCFGVSEHPA